MYLDLVYLNQLAQSCIPLEDGEKWFDALSNEDQIVTLEHIIFFIQQSGIVAQDASLFMNDVLQFSKIKPQSTPIQMIKSIENSNIKGTSALKIILKKFLLLPSKERKQSFLVLLGILNGGFKQQVRQYKNQP